MPKIKPVKLMGTAKLTNTTKIKLRISVALLATEPPTWQFVLLKVKSRSSQVSHEPRKSLSTRVFPLIPNRDDVKMWVEHYSPDEETAIDVVENALRLIGMLYRTKGVFSIDCDPYRLFFRVPTKEDNTWGIRFLMRFDEWAYGEVTSARRTTTVQWSRSKLMEAMKGVDFLTLEKQAALLDEIETLCPDAFAPETDPIPISQQS